MTSYLLSLNKKEIPFVLLIIGGLLFALVHSGIGALVSVPREFNGFVVSLALFFKSLYVVVALAIVAIAYALLRTFKDTAPEINLLWVLLPSMLSSTISLIVTRNIEDVIYLFLLLILYGINHWQRKRWVLYLSFSTYLICYASVLHIATKLYFLDYVGVSQPSLHTVLNTHIKSPHKAFFHVIEMPYSSENEKAVQTGRIETRVTGMTSRARQEIIRFMKLSYFDEVTLQKLKAKDLTLFYTKTAKENSETFPFTLERRYQLVGFTDRKTIVMMPLYTGM